VLVLHLHQHLVKPQLAPAILSQESVDTTLSITQGSDHPPVLEPHMVLNSPLMSALTTHTFGNPKEKEKEKKRIKETPTSDRKPKKGKEQDHLKKTSRGPLRQGQRLDTSETKLCSRKERKPPNQSSKNHKELPLNQYNPPGRMHARHHLKQGSCNSPALTGQTGQHHRSDRCATCEQD
jgi:hypothetical protein